MDDASSFSSAGKFLEGIDYAHFLKQIHDVHMPSSYLEIGVATGHTLALSHCRSVAIDLEFNLQGNSIGQRSETYFFQMTSDDFFATHDLKTFLPNGPSFAFLDGLHHFEYLLRDFMNTEKYSRSSAIIALHDCYPINTEMANREPNQDRRLHQVTRHWWTGDVWKLLPILRDFRPDLEVTLLDCPPTGLVVVRQLDSDSKILSDAYDEIVAKYQNIELRDFGLHRLQTEFPTSDSRRVFQPDVLKAWLASETRS